MISQTLICAGSSSTTSSTTSSCPQKRCYDMWPIFFFLSHLAGTAAFSKACLELVWHTTDTQRRAGVPPAQEVGGYILSVTGGQVGNVSSWKRDINRHNEKQGIRPTQEQLWQTQTCTCCVTTKEITLQACVSRGHVIPLISGWLVQWRFACIFSLRVPYSAKKHFTSIF